MRISFLSAILAVIFLFHSNYGVRAAVWVEQISGNAQAVIVTRKGQFLKAEEMMRLQPGDVVKVTDDKSSVRILLGSGAIKKIAKAQSPFTVAGKESGGSFLSNLMGEVKNMLVASADQTEAVAMMTRGRSHQLKMLAAGAEENLVLAGTKTLTIDWQGGSAPYDVSLLNEESEKPLILKSALFKQQVVFETGKIGEEGLIAGEYQILVDGAGADIETNLLVVDRDQLPDNAQKLLGLGLDKRVEARFLINLLYKQPEWRLFANSLAVGNGLTKESQMLHAMK